MEILTVAGYDEQNLPSLKRKHFMLLGNTQQLVAGALSEHGKPILHYDHMSPL